MGVLFSLLTIMLLLLQVSVFRIFNLIVEGLFRLILPLLKLILKRISFTDSLHPDGPYINSGVLIHAASLGEVNAVRSLILELSRHVSPDRIAITTTTVAGLRAASLIHPDIKARLSVLDVHSLRKKQLSKISPGLICIVETEIWPNLLYCAKQEGIPIIFLNARLGPKSLKRLRLIKPLIGYIGSTIAEIMAKSAEDAARFKEIFTAPVSIAGNLKFALKPKDYDYNQLRADWGFSEHNLLLCAGSTRPGEEALLLHTYKELLHQYPNLKLIIAPRHPQRMEDVKRIYAAPGYSLYSQMDVLPSHERIMIIDMLGHLNEAYSICDVAIVGGSFYDFGGHNPLEPAYYSKAIVIGPYHSSCLESVRELAKSEAIVICESKDLTIKLVELLGHTDKRLAMGIRAKEVIVRFQNSLDLHLNGILRWIS